MKKIFKKLYVTQEYLIENAVLWYLNNDNNIPIPVRQVAGKDKFLIIDGHNQLAADLLGKKEPLIKIVKHAEDLISPDDFPIGYKEKIDERNGLIEEKYGIILDFKHQKKKRTIVDLMNYVEKGFVNSFMNNMFMFQEDYKRAGHDFFKMNNIRDDIYKFKR
jgi:hypothetical protein